MMTNTIPYKVQELFLNKIKCDTSTVLGCDSISNDLINFYKEAHPHVQDIFKISAELFSNDNGEIKISYKKDNKGTMGSYNHHTNTVELQGYDEVGPAKQHGYSFTNDEFIPALVHEMSHQVMWKIFEYTGSPYLFNLKTTQADEISKSAFDKGFAQVTPRLAKLTEAALQGRMLFVYDPDTVSNCNLKYFAGIIGNTAYEDYSVDDEVVVRYYQTLAAKKCKDTSRYFAPMSQWHKTHVIPKAIEKGLLHSKDESSLEDNKASTIDDSTASNLEDNADSENNNQITIESVKNEIESLEYSFEKDYAYQALEFLKDSKYFYLAPKFISHPMLGLLKLYAPEFADKILNIDGAIWVYRGVAETCPTTPKQILFDLSKKIDAFAPYTALQMINELESKCSNGASITPGKLSLFGNIINIDGSEHSTTVDKDLLDSNHLEDDKASTIDDSTASHLEDNADSENNNQITIESVKNEIESLEYSFDKDYAYQALEFLKDSKYFHLAPKFTDYEVVKVLKSYGTEFADKILNIDTSLISIYTNTLEHCGVDHANLALELGAQMTRSHKSTGDYGSIRELFKICYHGNFIYNGDANDLQILGDIAHKYYVAQQHTEL